MSHPVHIVSVLFQKCPDSAESNRASRVLEKKKNINLEMGNLLCAEDSSESIYSHHKHYHNHCHDQNNENLGVSIDSSGNTGKGN